MKKSLAILKQMAIIPQEQPADPAPKEKTKRKGKGKLPKPSATGLNRMEAKYAAHLDALVLTGEVVDWWFEPFNLQVRDLKQGRASEDAREERDRLKQNRTSLNVLRYTPDFLVQLPDGTLEIHELKGFRENAGVARFKAAAVIHLYLTFRLVEWKDNQWTTQEFP